MSQIAFVTWNGGGNQRRAVERARELAVAAATGPDARRLPRDEHAASRPVLTPRTTWL